MCEKNVCWGDGQFSAALQGPWPVTKLSEGVNARRLPQREVDRLEDVRCTGHLRSWKCHNADH